MTHDILTENLIEAGEKIKQSIFAKINEKFNYKRTEIAQSLYNEEHDDEEEDEADKPEEKHDEVSDESFSKSFVGRLKNAEDMDNHPITDAEKSDPNDKRVQKALKIRAEKGIAPTEADEHRNIPLKDGSSVKLKDGDAARINSFMMGLKPQKRQEVIDHMQKSNKHFNSVHDVIKKFPGYNVNKSIYEGSKDDDYEVGDMGAKPYHPPVDKSWKKEMPLRGGSRTNATDSGPRLKIDMNDFIKSFPNAKVRPNYSDKNK